MSWNGPNSPCGSQPRRLRPHGGSTLTQGKEGHHEGFQLAAPAYDTRVALSGGGCAPPLLSTVPTLCNPERCSQGGPPPSHQLRLCFASQWPNILCLRENPSPPRRRASKDAGGHLEAHLPPRGWSPWRLCAPPADAWHPEHALHPALPSPSLSSTEGGPRAQPGPFMPALPDPLPPSPLSEAQWALEPRRPRARQHRPPVCTDGASFRLSSFSRWTLCASSFVNHFEISK